MKKQYDDSRLPAFVKEYLGEPVKSTRNGDNFKFSGYRLALEFEADNYEDALKVLSRVVKYSLEKMR